MGKGYKGTPKERFLRKTQKLSEDDCWLWTGGKTHDGYGKFWMSKTMKAHKVSYLLFVGEVSGGLCVLHSCDNPTCVNPKHLWLGTQFENIHDREQKNRGRGRNNKKYE